LFWEKVIREGSHADTVTLIIICHSKLTTKSWS
jgi:hypothetical protein